MPDKTNLYAFGGTSEPVTAYFGAFESSATTGLTTSEDFNNTTLT